MVMRQSTMIDIRNRIGGQSMIVVIALHQHGMIVVSSFLGMQHRW